MRLSSYDRHRVLWVVLPAVMLLAGGVCRAEYKSASRVPLRHYIGLSMGGGAATDFYRPRLVQSQLGAAANVRLSYELEVNQWLIGLDVEASYQYLRDTVADFTDGKAWRDRDGDDCHYEYVYRGYHQRDHALGVAAQLHVGRRFGDYAYLLLGGRVYVPVTSYYEVQTGLFTQGQYAWAITPVRSEGISDYSVYGYYPEGQYSYRSTYKDYLRAGASAEVGSYIPLGDKRKNRLRVGLYCNYDFRLGSAKPDQLADYERVDHNPLTMNRDNLAATIRWNPVNKTELVPAKLPHNMEIGLRLSYLIDVTPQKRICMCY